MECNFYHQILEKASYLEAVCDSLMVNLNNQQMKYMEGKKNFNQYMSSSYHQASEKSVQLERCIQLQQNKNYVGNKNNNLEYKNNNIEQLKRVKQKEKQIFISIEQHRTLLLQLRKSVNEISLEIAVTQPLKNTKKAQKKIRQTLQVQQQIQSQKKILNGQLQQLNLIQKNSSQVKYHISTFQQKQKRLVKEIQLERETQTKYLQYKKRQEKYSELIEKKQHLYNKNMADKDWNDKETFNKVQATAQSRENLNQMQKYEKELHGMIMQQELIVEEIKKREKLTESKTPKTVLKQLDTIVYDDVQPINQEIQNLKRTIHNRRHKNKKLNLKQNRNLQTSQSPSFRKDINRSSQESTHLEIQPICHPKNQKKYNFSSHNGIQITQVQGLTKSKESKDNSLPILSKSVQKNKKFPSTQFRIKKNYDLDTLQADVLKKIISKKQARFNQIVARNSEFAPQNFSFRPDTKIQRKMITQPIHQTPKKSLGLNNIQSSNLKVSADSRLIEQLLRSQQNLQELQKNIRVRTKKTQQQKYKQVMLQKSRRKYKKPEGQEKTSKSFSLPPSSGNRNFSQPLLSKLKKSQKMNYADCPHNASFQLSNKGSFEQSTTPSRRSSKLKYASKVQTFSPDNDNIQCLMKKISFIKKQENLNSSNSRTNKLQYQAESLPKDKDIKVYKLSRRPRNRSSFSYVRKGKAQVTQQQYSSQGSDTQLPQIKEQQESIRNTGHSITYR